MSSLFDKSVAKKKPTLAKKTQPEPQAVEEPEPEETVTPVEETMVPLLDEAYFPPSIDGLSPIEGKCLILKLIKAIGDDFAQVMKLKEKQEIELDNLDDRAADLKVQNHGLELQIKRMPDRIGKVTAMLKEKNFLTEEEEMAREKTDDLRKRIKTQKKQLKTLKKNIDESEELKSEISAEMEKLRARVTTQSKEMKEFERRFSSLKKAVEKDQKYLGELAEERDDLAKISSELEEVHQLLM